MIRPSALLAALLLTSFFPLHPFPAHGRSSGPAYLEEPWARTGGPPGGVGYDIRMRPDAPDTMYVTDAGAGVFRSTDGGQSWSPINTGIECNDPVSRTAMAIPGSTE